MLGQILKDIEQLTRGVTDEAKKDAILRDYFKKDTNGWKNQVGQLSDEDLDTVAGGQYTVGDIYKCEDYKVVCKSLSYGTSLDICSIIPTNC